ncbi:histidine kinase, partial [Diaporthe helianthi]
VGPRKLAKVLSLAFNRWAAVNAEWVSSGAESPAAVVTTQAAATTAEPKGPLLQQQQQQHGLERPPLRPRPLSRSSGSDDSGINVRSAASSQEDLPTRAKPQQQRQAVVAAGGSPTDAGAQVRVLLVEDNPINLKILSAVMRKLGIKFHTATNGQEAVDAYKEDPGRCVYILTDVSMPVMDGFESTRQIRAYERALGLVPATVIALSGLASAQSQKEAFGSGMDLFLTKPVKFKELRAILRSRGLFR